MPSGAQLGTRFLLARESGAHPAYRERLLAATETHTAVAHAFTGRPARALRNRFLDEYLKGGPEPLPWPVQSLAAGDVYGAEATGGDLSLHFAGQGLRMLDREQGAAEIVAAVVDRGGGRPLADKRWLSCANLATTRESRLHFGLLRTGVRRG